MKVPKLRNSYGYADYTECIIHTRSDRNTVRDIDRLVQGFPQRPVYPQLQRSLMILSYFVLPRLGNRLVPSCHHLPLYPVYDSQPGSASPYRSLRFEISTNELITRYVTEA